jgi:hypothetical protein
MALTDIKSQLPDFITSALYLNAEEGEQTGEESAVTEYSSIGPSSNEETVFYQFGGGAHHFRVLKQASPDIVLTHQSKMVAFYLKLDSTNEITPIPRELKDFFLLDANMKV